MSNTTPDYSETKMDVLIEKAKGEDAAAQAELGLRFYNGVKGAAQSLVKGFDLSRNAAEQGNPQAQNTLGAAYYNRHGVEQNFETAAELFRQAAHQGSLLAQYNLGVAYASGNGVAQNFETAAELFKEVAKSGTPEARLQLIMLHDFILANVSVSLKAGFDEEERGQRRLANEIMKSLNAYPQQPNFALHNAATAESGTDSLEHTGEQ